MPCVVPKRGFGRQREGRGLSWLAAAGRDIGHGWRGLRRTPVVFTAGIVTLALGIGAPTAIFSVVDRILFRPLPYPHHGELVSVGLLAPVADNNELLMAPAYLRLRDRQTPFRSMAAFGFTSDCDLTETHPERLRCARVDAPYLPTFGIEPMAGRNFSPGEDTRNAPPVALLAYGFWQRRFAGDYGIVGRPIPIDGRQTTVIGILPRSFELFNLSPVDLLVPAALDVHQEGRAVRAFARLKPGIGIRQARLALEPLLAQAQASVPPSWRRGLTLVVRSLRDRQVAPVRAASWTLLGAVALVLLMVCVNIANLLLVRAHARRAEFAIRRALGATPARLACQRLSESLLLAGIGAVAGCFLAWALLRFFIAAAPGGITRLEQASIDGRVLLFAAGAAVAVGVLCGLASMRGQASQESGRVVNCLVTAEIAVSLVLLTGAGILLRQLWRLERVPLGMDPDRAIAANIVLSRTYPPKRLLAFFAELESHLDHLPGATAAAITSSLPPYGGVQGTAYSALNVEGRRRLPDGAGSSVAWRYITPGYFRALGVPIRRGRGFGEQDRTPGARSIVLSQSLANRLFREQDPIGKRIFQNARGEWHTVIGVVGDVRNNGLIEPTIPEYYLVRKPSADEVFGSGANWRAASIVVRGPLEPHAMGVALRAEIAKLDPTLPVHVQTLRQRVAALTGLSRFNALLLTGFAAVGLVLGATGVYGVMAFLTGRRRREIGVRLALGATPAGIVGLFLSHATRWVSVGIGLGLAGSWAAARLLASVGAGLPALDAWSFVVAAGLLAAVAVAAAWLPARRAAVVDPWQILRE